MQAEISLAALRKKHNDGMAELSDQLDAVHKARTKYVAVFANLNFLYVIFENNFLIFFLSFRIFWFFFRLEKEKLSLQKELEELQISADTELRQRQSLDRMVKQVL